MKQIEHDGMPKEVAIELLVEPCNRLTSRMRKNCMAAREVCYTADVPRKSLTQKLTNKLHNRSLVWIGRELKRAGKQRAGLQRKYEALLRQPVKSPVIAARIAAINVLVGHLDMFVECAEDELTWRKKLTTGEAPGVLGVLVDPALRRTFFWARHTRTRPCWVHISLSGYYNPRIISRLRPCPLN
jgi:hypothetical protein